MCFSIDDDCYHYKLQVQSLTAERDGLLNQLKCLQKHANNTESSLAQEQVEQLYASVFMHGDTLRPISSVLRQSGSN